jgi:putative DNA primase/helicase
MSLLQSWASLLGGEVSGGQVLCPGPGHSASDRSLSVKVGKDGQPVVHSHAGDDWHECLDYVRQRLGMAPWKPNSGRKLVATYEFVDPVTGDVRYRKERVEGEDGDKLFFFKPAGRNGSEPMLYGGERLADAAEDQPVFIVEGEKKVDRLRELGAVAVSGDSGSSSKWLPSHSDLLRGLQVILWPDSDEPGEKYISRAAACLQGSAASLRVVRPFGLPNGAKGLDVCDWKGNAEDLWGLVEGAGGYAARQHEPVKRKSKIAAAEPVAGEHWTELGNAHRLIFQHGADARYVHPLKAWFIWDGNFWRRDDSADIMRRAETTIESMFEESKSIADDAMRQAFRKFALKSQARAQLGAMVTLAQHNLKVVLSPDDMDSDPMLLGVLNGTIDLNTGKFREGRRGDYITKQCHVAFDETAQCPNWIAFQKKVAGGNMELVAYKQRVFGLLLTGRMVEILFILHGAGQNGKSTEFETISGLLGDYAHAAAVQVLLEQKTRPGATPEIVAVKGKRAVFINESGDSDNLSESRVKYLCGDDTMSGRNLYEGIINFRPTHKTLLRTNHKPKIRGTDLGIWRRIHYLPYLVTITDEEKIVDFRGTVLEPERAGILNWMLAGLKDYLAVGLCPPAVVSDATKKYRNEMDTTGQWIAAMCERSTVNAKLRLKTLYKSYSKWALDEVGMAVSRQKLADALREHEFYDIPEHGICVFKNIRLNDPEAEPY